MCCEAEHRAGYCGVAGFLSASFIDSNRPYLTDIANTKYYSGKWIIVNKAGVDDNEETLAENKQYGRELCMKTDFERDKLAHYVK